MVAQKYQEKREQVKMEGQQVVTVGQTDDMWTSVNMEAYLTQTFTT